VDRLDKRSHRRVAAQLVRHPAAGQDQPVERRRVDRLDRGIDRHRQAVLAAHRPGRQADARHPGALLAETHDGDPELEILHAFAGEDGDVHPVELHQTPPGRRRAGTARA
jgi:hypothetical protein